MYPEAQEGYKRVVIYLKKKAVEDNFKVELTVGKQVEVDKCNRHFLVGDLKEQTVSGWGYTYFDFKSSGDVAGTKMGCPTDEKELKFVTGQSKLINYNSKLPVVVYVPVDMDVEYRIWKAPKKWSKTK